MQEQRQQLQQEGTDRHALFLFCLFLCLSCDCIVRSASCRVSVRCAFTRRGSGLAHRFVSTQKRRQRRQTDSETERRQRRQRERRHRERERDRDKDKETESKRECVCVTSLSHTPSHTHAHAHRGSASCCCAQPAAAPCWKAMHCVPPAVRAAALLHCLWAPHVLLVCGFRIPGQCV